MAARLSELTAGVLAMQTGYLMLSMGDIAGAEAMFDRAAGRPQVFLSDRNMFIMSAVPGAHTLKVVSRTGFSDIGGNIGGLACY